MLFDNFGSGSMADNHVGSMSGNPSASDESKISGEVSCPPEQH